MGFVVSFATFGAIWLVHNAITDYLERADAGLIRLALLLLMVVSFLPFPTRLHAEHIGEDRPERVAATIDGITLLLAALLGSVLWRYAVREQLVRPDASDEEVQLLTKRPTPWLAGYMVLIALGLFLPIAAVFGYLVIAIYFIVPLRQVRRGRR